MNGGLVNCVQGIRLTGSQTVQGLSGFIRCRADSAWPAPPRPSSVHASRTGGLCDCLSTVTAPTAHDSDQRTGLISSHSKPLLSPSPTKSSIPAPLDTNLPSSIPSTLNKITPIHLTLLPPFYSIISLIAAELVSIAAADSRASTPNHTDLQHRSSGARLLVPILDSDHCNNDLLATQASRRYTGSLVTGKKHQDGPESSVTACSPCSAPGTFMSQGDSRTPPSDRRPPPSTPLHYYGPLPYPAVRLIIGQHFDEDPETGYWALFIAAAFYDSDNRRLWQTEILLGQFPHLEQPGWTPRHGQEPGEVTRRNLANRESPQVHAQWSCAPL